MLHTIFKRTVLLLLLLFLTVSLTVPAFADEVPTQTHTLYINGRTDGRFAPKANLSRAELAQMIFNLGDYPEAPGRFTDVSDIAWYAKPVNALAEAGILNGYSDGTFRPKAQMTRAALVTVLQRLSGKTATQEAGFTDLSPSHWAYDAIALAREMGWVVGYSDGTFRPSRPVTRAEVVTVLNRYLDRVPDREAIDAASDLRFFPDVQPGSWYYYDVMEASVTHTVGVSEEGEVWVDVEPSPANLADGFYVIGGKLYAAENGAFVHEAKSGSLGGYDYTCGGTDGVCTVQAVVLPLYNGSLIFLKDGKPEIPPGRYSGFYLRDGNLYAAEDGELVHAVKSGTVNGIRYECSGASGICSVDASVLALADGELVFLKDGLPEIMPGSFVDGFYLRDGNIYAAYHGSLIHTAKRARLFGTYFTCAGANGLCTVEAEAVTLVSGDLLLLRNGLAELEPGSYPDGFYVSGQNLYAAYQGYLIHTARTAKLFGISFTCAGKDGVCTAQTQIVRLWDGELALLRDGKPDGVPGAYTDGFRVRNGLLYVVCGGHVLREKTTGSFAGHSYACAGASGICTADWSNLPLDGIDLNGFAALEEAGADCSFSDVSPDSPEYAAIALQCRIGTMSGNEDGCFSPDTKLTFAEAIHAAVAIYESYFQVDRPQAQTDLTYDLERAKLYGILSREVPNYNASIPRGDVAIMLVRALRGRELAAINQVDYIPGLSEDHASYASFMTLYGAGVMRGVNEQEEAVPAKGITRGDFAQTLNRLILPQQRMSFSVFRTVIKTIQYGTSGSGKYPLTAYQLGSGPNVMVLTFAVHGWEDVWVQDGKALVYLADRTKQYLENNYSLVAQGGWTVYILRCVNPDGLYDGVTNDGPGRCTTTYYNANGVLITDDGRGIDINRCFPHNYTVRTDDRNFNGTAPLQCAEARALATFTQDVKGSGKNICIDTHGWLSQIITSSGKGTIYNAFLRKFPYNSYADLRNASGYYSSWAYSIGYDSCLFELPWGLSNYDQFVSSGYIEKYIAVITDLLENYENSGAIRGPYPPDECELDGN